MFTIDREKFKLAQKISRFGIWRWNLKDNTLTWDDRLYEIYGLSPDLEGVTYQKWAELLDPVSLKEVEQSASDLIAGTTDYFDHVFPARKVDGTPLWIRTVAQLYRDQGGQPLEILGANFDLTEEVTNKKTIETLLRDIERLKNLDSQTAQLANIGRQVGGVGHDINNSLAIILGFTQKMIREHSNPTRQEGETLSWLQKIYKAGTRIKDIIDGLRELQNPMAQSLGTPILVAIVTHDSDQQKRIHDYFSKMQYQIHSFASSLSALDFLSKPQNVDLIVVDSKLPDMDGLSLIVEINHKGFASKALKIVLGEDERSTLENRVQDFRFGMVDGFLEKPVSEKDLERLVYRIANRDPTDLKVS